jgi:hypothetical protein
VAKANTKRASFLKAANRKSLTMQDKLRIKRFVRESLGCTCPDEVFDHIEFLPELEPDLKRIIIGDRLLVFIWQAMNSADIPERLPILLDSGISEKDSRGLNRFRMVLVIDNLNSISPMARNIFNNNIDKDENIHLRIIEKKEFSI